MSANSGSDGTRSGYDSIGRDVTRTDGNSALWPWDSDHYPPASKTTTEGSGSAPAPEPGERD